MKGGPLLAGCLAGLLLSLGLSDWITRQRPPPPARLISDADGALADICIQYRRDFHAAVIDTLADLFEALGDEVAIRVIVERQAEFDFLKRELAGRGGTRLGRLTAVVTGFPVTPWARDRFGALAADGKPVIAVPPVRSNMPGPRGQDDRVPELLAASLPGSTCRPLPFLFEGGDLLADADRAFILANCLARNSPRDVDDRPELLRVMETALGKPIVLIGETPEQVPDHHICMVLTPLGDNRVAVADPWQGLDAWQQDPPVEAVDVETNLSAYAPFGNVIRSLEENGFEVVRIPFLLTRTPRVYVSYNNVILERRGADKRVYMPVYGMPSLDRAAGEAFEKQGWRVMPIRVAKLYRHTGSLRCQVGVIRRRE